MTTRGYAFVVERDWANDRKHEARSGPQREYAYVWSSSINRCNWFNEFIRWGSEGEEVIDGGADGTDLIEIQRPGLKKVRGRAGKHL